MKTRFLPLAVFFTVLASGLAIEPDKSFVAHEWGTFTSVQGADGVQMFWNPLIAPDLPNFVYDRTRPRNGKVPGFQVASKTGMMSRQRMETPVIYFYSDRPRTVDVGVKFPEGTVTEWYPQEDAALFGPSPAPRTSRLALEWKGVEILPKTAAQNVVLPIDPSGSHYYAARETDANVLRVTSAEKKAEVEKFLFYRGVASFEAPLTVKLDEADARKISLTNKGPEALRHLFVYQITMNGGLWLALENLQPGETRSVMLDDSSARPISAADTSLEKAGEVSSMRLNTSLVDALVKEGLYLLEAKAMVKTWEDSWFAEKGVRVLYTLPRAWTDRTLPLTVSPAPISVERVMVARAEVITPTMEKNLLSLVERYISSDAAARPAIIAETRALGLGRFTEATLRRVSQVPPGGQQRKPEFYSLSWELLQAASAPVKPSIQSAAN